jgi:hypothetical protein
MTSPRKSAHPDGSADPDRLPRIWWLWLPLATALALLLLGQYAPRFYDRWIGSEDRGLLELSHVVLPLASMLLAIRILFMPQLREIRALYGLVALIAIACLYIAGEEASWGQHYLGWVTPEGWQALNDQGETNLHNISSWLDQKPRALLEAAIVFGGILVPLFALWKPQLRQGHFALVLPPLACLPVALLAEVSKLTDRLADVLGPAAHLFRRASEVQELYFYLFILLYLIVLRRRLVEF